MAVFALMAVYAAIALVWRIKLCEILAMACAPIGAAFTLITLVTGSIWGKPMWGTWWDWDPRLTTELILLFLYLGVIGPVQRHRRPPRRRARRGLPGHRRRGAAAGDPLFGGVVELAAPGPDDPACSASRTMDPQHAARRCLRWSSAPSSGSSARCWRARAPTTCVARPARTGCAASGSAAPRDELPELRRSPPTRCSSSCWRWDFVAAAAADPPRAARLRRRRSRAHARKPRAARNVRRS